MRQIHTKIRIPAPPEAVFEVLRDFPSHAEWNPFVRFIEGSLEVGERIAVTIQPPGGRSVRLRPRIVHRKRNTSFEWLGHLGVPGLFDGRHRFEALPVAESETRFIHSETFTGLLVPLMWRMVHRPTRAGFEAMNVALRERVVHVATRSL